MGPTRHFLALLIQCSERCIAYRFPPCADRRTPPHSVVRCTDSHLRRPLERQRSSLRPPLPHRPHLRVGPGLKSSPARIAPRLCSRLPPSGQPTGKSDGGGVGGAGRGRSNKIVGPSCHRFGSSSGASVVYVPISTRADRRAATASSAVRCTASHPNADRWNATAVLSVRRFLTVRTCVLGPV